jgi:hypothetical protein
MPKVLAAGPAALVTAASAENNVAASAQIGMMTCAQTGPTADTETSVTADTETSVTASTETDATADTLGSVDGVGPTAGIKVVAWAMSRHVSCRVVGALADELLLGRFTSEPYPDG